MDEHRVKPRLRALKAGRLILPGGYSTFDCMIRNLSEGGAKITLESTVPIPEHFDLKFEDGTTHSCRVCWRNPKELGVEFMDVVVG